MLKDCKPGQRLRPIDVSKDFDAVVLVLLDEDFKATAIYEAGRVEVLAALAKAEMLAKDHALQESAGKSDLNLILNLNTRGSGTSSTRNAAPVCRKVCRTRCAHLRL